MNARAIRLVASTSRAAVHARPCAAAARVSASSSRVPVVVAASATRPAALAHQSRAFSCTPARFGGQTDASLSAKLAEELAFEQDAASAEGGQKPEWLEEFESNGVWRIVDAAGADEVSLERHFGGEKLRITFSISDLDNPPDTSDLEPAAASENASDEDPLAPAAESFPVRCSLYITKPSTPGALVMDLLVEDEQFVIDNISYYKEKGVAEDMSAEGDWKRRGIYIGPRFDHLDASVQAEFESFLEEREVNEALAGFIPLYCEYKEQKEYVTWLGHVKGFIDQ